MGNLSPQQRKIAIALLGAAVLAVIAIVGSRRGPGAADATEEETTGTGGRPPFGSTFADNSEAAAGLSSAITGGLADVADALMGVTASQETLNATIGTIPDASSAAAGAAAGTAAAAAVESALSARMAETPPTPPATLAGDQRTAPKAAKAPRPFRTTPKPKPKRAKPKPKTPAREKVGTVVGASGGIRGQRTVRKPVRTPSTRSTPSKRPAAAPKPPQRKKKRR